MRLLPFVLGIFAVVAAMGMRAEAQNYPWCAYYSGGDGGGGGTNCGFISFEQCMATVRGIGGFCDQNTQYQPPPGPHPSPKVQKRNPRASRLVRPQTIQGAG